MILDLQLYLWILLFYSGIIKQTYITNSAPIHDKKSENLKTKMYIIDYIKFEFNVYNFLYLGFLNLLLPHRLHI